MDRDTVESRMNHILTMDRDTVESRMLNTRLGKGGGVRAPTLHDSMCKEKAK